MNGPWEGVTRRVDLRGGTFRGGPGHYGADDPVANPPWPGAGGGPALAGEGGRDRDAGSTDGPVPGHPADDDRGCRRSGRGAGEGERAEHAALHSAEPIWQRDEPAAQL